MGVIVQEKQIFTPCFLRALIYSQKEIPIFGVSDSTNAAQPLQQGGTARFSGRRLWIRIGAPWNLAATLNGKAATLPSSLGNVVVTEGGLSP